MTDVYTLNAFTDSTSGGNPAGVVPNATELDESAMQSIAREVGYSETAFVQPSHQADFKVRFFTPAAEVDLCGHATIATFTLLFKLGKLGAGSYTQETRAGVLAIEISESGEVFMTQAKPAIGAILDRQTIADSLNISVASLHETLQPQLVSTGLWDIIIPIRDLKTLTDIRPNFENVSAVSRDTNAVGYHLFSTETLYGAQAHCRNLAPLYDIPEEAATGTASGALASYMFIHNLLSLEQARDLTFEQGYSMNRPSTIKARLTVDDAQIAKVEVGGTATIFGEILHF